VSTPTKRSGRVILEANQEYWDKSRSPRVKRVVFDNILSQKDAVDLVKSGEGRMDLVTDLSPVETLRVAQSTYATVMKNRGALVTVFGQFNIRKTESPWRDVRLRQALNYAVNRTDLIQYAAKGNGVVIPALIPAQAFGYDPNLAPYTFDPVKAKDLLRQGGYPEERPISLIAPEGMEVQATVVSKMLEQVGLKVRAEILDAVSYNRKTLLSGLDQPSEKQIWDIALTANSDVLNFPAYLLYHYFALDGPFDWVAEQPDLRQLYDRVLQTVDRDKQRTTFQQMERHTRDQAYFLFLYSPVQLYAVNKGVHFVPYVANLNFTETSVSDQHWSVRKGVVK
jgi:peptide/nickel transport system substrate-binding protein